MKEENALDLLIELKQEVKDIKEQMNIIKEESFKTRLLLSDEVKMKKQGILIFGVLLFAFALFSLFSTLNKIV